VPSGPHHRRGSRHGPRSPSDRWSRQRHDRRRARRRASRPPARCTRASHAGRCGTSPRAGDTTSRLVSPLQSRHASASIRVGKDAITARPVRSCRIQLTGSPSIVSSSRTEHRGSRVFLLQLVDLLLLDVPQDRAGVVLLRRSTYTPGPIPVAPRDAGRVDGGGSQRRLATARSSVTWSGSTTYRPLLFKS
jgi:hypothetical protein